MLACVLIPYFASAVERRLDPALASNPLVIHTTDTVFAMSAEAAQAGIQPGLALREAQAIYGDGWFIPATPVRYRSAFAQLLSSLGNFTHRVEPGDQVLPEGKERRRKKTSQDLPFSSDDGLSAVVYLELANADDVLDSARSIVRTIQSQVGLTASVGLARGRFPARMAATVVPPSGEKVILAGQEGAFLASLPVRLLPLEDDLKRRMQALGIQTLDQLARFPADTVSTQFGKTGALRRQEGDSADDRLDLHNLDTTEEIARHQAGMVTDRATMNAILSSIAEDVSLRLQQSARMGRSLSLTLALGNGQRHENRLMLRQPVSSASHIAQILSQFISQAPIQHGVQAVEVRLADLVPAVGQQLDLFIHQAGQDKRLRAALKDAIARYGAECDYWLSLDKIDARQAERQLDFQHGDRP